MLGTRLSNSHPLGRHRVSKIDLLPLGEGDLPIPELVANIPANVKDIIVELDYCNVEMLEALRRSYVYMTSNGLAEGNK